MSLNWKTVISPSSAPISPRSARAGSPPARAVVPKNALCRCLEAPWCWHGRISRARCRAVSLPPPAWYPRVVAAILPWIQQHWFDLVQTLGIIASIAFTAASVRRDRRGRRMTDHLALVAQHRELWADVNRREDLRRILMREVDLVKRPISLVEEDYLSLVLVHYTAGWHMARQGGLVDLKVLATDAAGFFSLPIPKYVFETTVPQLDPSFVAFIRDSIAAPKTPRPGRLKRSFLALCRLCLQIISFPKDMALLFCAVAYRMGGEILRQARKAWVWLNCHARFRRGIRVDSSFQNTDSPSSTMGHSYSGRRCRTGQIRRRRQERW